MISLLFALVINAGAVTLPDIEATSEKALPVDTAQPNIACDQIAKRLEDYNKMARQHDVSVANFLNEVTGKMSIWYDMLSPLEGTQQILPVGVFAPLQDGTGKITQVADLAWENSALLANEMDRIKTSLGECVVTPQGPPGGPPNIK